MLTREQVKTFYNRWGSKQDSQSFYEDAATTDLALHSHLEEARSIFEFGIGTGRFARKLLEEILPYHCLYTGIDISPTMVNLSKRKLDFWDNRVTVRLSDGSAQTSESDGSFDHFIANYVFDLMDDRLMVEVIQEAHRILAPEGWLCLVSLTRGKNLLERGISAVWNMLYRWRPRVVGGCRPIELEKFVSTDQWQLEYHSTVAAFGIRSEVLVAKRLSKNQV